MIVPRLPARLGRVTWVSVVVGVLALSLTVAAVALGSVFRSPEQAAADALPPPPSRLTATAELRVLAEPVVLRGTVMPGEGVKVTAPAAAVGPDAVVTRVKAKAGDTLLEGSVPVELKGRPLICLALPFPLYRDIVGWATGPDLDALQRALRRMGYGAPTSRTMDAATQDALADFYRDRGYQVPVGDQSILLSTAEAHDTALAAHDTAQSAYEVALTAYEAAVEEGGDTHDAKAALDAAKVALDTAQATLDKAAAAHNRAKVSTGPMLVRSEFLVVTAAGQRVTAVPAVVGAVVEDSKFALMELDGGASFVSVLTTQNQAGMLKAGLEATAFDEASGTSAKLRVSNVATDVVTDAASGQVGYPVRFEFEGEPLKAIDRTVRVEVTPNVSLEPTLAVPVTAVFAAADRSTYVTVVGPEDRTADVPVTTGQSGGGWVAIIPSHADAVRVGTVVVVGIGG